MSKMERGNRLTSIGAITLAFLASQHHTFMMLLLAFGLGDAAMGFMKVAPAVREVMLSMSLAMVVVLAFQMRDVQRPRSMRIICALSIVATLGLSAWSVMRFGL